jgi:hypothetical protein
MPMSPIRGHEGCRQLHAELMPPLPADRAGQRLLPGCAAAAVRVPEFRKYFANRYDEFSDNWVQVVGDAPVERLTVIGVKPYGRGLKADRSHVAGMAGPTPWTPTPSWVSSAR